MASAKRFKYDHSPEVFGQCEPPAWTWPTAVDNDDDPSTNSSSKRGLEELFSRAAKRFKYDPVVVSEEEHSCDSNYSEESMMEDLLDEGAPLTDQVRVLDRILSFMDSLSLQRYKAVSKHWKECCENALTGRQLTGRQLSGKEFPRLVFDARFRIQEALGFPFFNNPFACKEPDLQIEISGLSWKGSMTRSVNLMDPLSNRFVKLITQNLSNNCKDGNYHDLKVLVERGRVFLKLDNHWLPGTIPVRELAKLLGICSWKGLPWTQQQQQQSSSEAMVEENQVPDEFVETMEE